MRPGRLLQESALEAACSGDAAADNAALCELKTNLDLTEQGLNVFFLLFAAALVFVMQSGFAMLCAGSVRQKNVKNIMLKNILDACGGAIGFWTLGFGFAFGDFTATGKSFIGGTNFCLVNFMRDPTSDGGTNLINFFFQWAFAATAATIVAGTVAERCSMAAYLCYSFALTAFVYPVIVHWLWSSNGYLSAFAENPFLGSGVIDFAGSGVVHTTGGITALVAAIVLGPRIGRFYDRDGNPLDKPAEWAPHSTALQCLGTFLLWFGWYGFNPGSTLIVTAGADYTTALAAVTSTLAAAAGAVSCMFLQCYLDYRETAEVTYDLTCVMNGLLSGLVAITSGCSVVTPWAAVIIGIISGWVYIGVSRLCIKLKIDDAVDAIPVHLGSGTWGMLAAGLFAAPAQTIQAYGASEFGLFYGGGKLLACQICGLLFIYGWVIVIMAPFFTLLNYFHLFRVDPLEEEVGLDISHHKGPGYDYAVPDSKHIEELELRRSQHGKVELPADVVKEAEESA